MKRNLIALVIASLATLAGINKANAQIVSNSSSLEYQMNATKTKNFMNEVETISPRALKNFADTYRNVHDESWMKIKGGFSVRFTLDDVRTTVLYDSKGHWVSSIKYYSEEKMLHEIRHIVKSTYYDYNIIYAQEIETADTKGMPTYIICLEDKTNIKMVRICEDEMSVWKEYTRAN
jgi:hypothetical protein